MKNETGYYRIGNDGKTSLSIFIFVNYVDLIEMSSIRKHRHHIRHFV